MIPCFIHKNTPELVKKLEDLGFTEYEDHYFEDEEYLYTTEGYLYLSEDMVDEIPVASRLSCEDSEDLFLGLSAHSYLTDYKNWFIIPEVKEVRGISGNILSESYLKVTGKRWYLYQERDRKLSLRLYELIESGELPKFLPHKATPEELINHFGNPT